MAGRWAGVPVNMSTMHWVGEWDMRGKAVARPVRLLYRTAFWDGSKIRYVRDFYGWDENVAKALGLAPGRPQKIDQPDSSDDIGP